MAEKKSKAAMSSSYTKEGAPLSVDDLKDVLTQVVYGSPAAFQQYMRTVSPVAEDRFIKNKEGKHLPIYEFDEATLRSIGRMPSIYGGYFPSKDAVFMNPVTTRRSGKSLDDLEEFRKTSGHEAFHAIQNYNPGLPESLHEFVLGSDPRGIGRQQYTAFHDLYSGIDPSISSIGENIPRSVIEAQAHLLSGTAPSIYSKYGRDFVDKKMTGVVKGSGLRQIVPHELSSYMGDPNSIAAAQRLMYSNIPYEAQKRLQSLQLPVNLKDGKIEPEQPSVPFAMKDAYNKFMSIIGLGNK